MSVKKNIEDEGFLAIYVGDNLRFWLPTIKFNFAGRISAGVMTLYLNGNVVYKGQIISPLEFIDRSLF